jgi:uncharacterized membrane protein required for colicin V production
MTWIDILLVAVIALLTYGGVKRGLIGEAFDLVIIFLGTIIAFNLAPYPSRLFHSLLHWPVNMSDNVSFMIIFLPIAGGIFTLGCVLERAARLNVVSKDVNSAGGGVLAFLKSWAVCWILLLLMVSFPSGDNFKRTLYRAPVAGIVRGLNSPFSSLIECLTPKSFSRKITATINKTEENPGKGNKR